MNLVLAITTYNRLSYLKACYETWEATRNPENNWRVVIADDGSTDGTIGYCESIGVKLIQNYQSGVHHQTNCIIKEIDQSGFDVCFKVDDDFFFKKSGWDALYLDAIKASGYDHLVYCNNARNKKFINDIQKGSLWTCVDYLHVLGCCFTITQRMIDTIGYFDIKSFGKQESGHVDYTRRCGNAGFNDPNTPFDVHNSNEYVGVTWQHEDVAYHHSLPEATRCSRRTIFDPITQPENFLKLSDERLYVEYSHIMNSYKLL